MVYGELGCIRVVQLWPKVRMGDNHAEKREMGPIKTEKTRAMLSVLRIES